MKIPNNQEIMVNYVVNNEIKFIETRSKDHSVYTIYEKIEKNDYKKLKSGSDLLKVREVLKDV